MKKTIIISYLFLFAFAGSIFANEVNILSKWRITSTFELLSNIENVYLLVTGENKSDILKEIGKDNELPVNQLIKHRKKTVLVTDQKI